MRQAALYDASRGPGEKPGPLNFYFAKYLPVILCPFWAISSGVPAATTRPPASPPPAGKMPDPQRGWRFLKESHASLSPNLPSHALHLIRTLGFEIRFDAPTLVDETTAIVAPPPKKEREHDMFRDFLLIRNHFYLHPIVFAVTFFPHHRTTLRSRFLGDGGLS